MSPLPIKKFENNFPPIALSYYSKLTGIDMEELSRRLIEDESAAYRHKVYKQVHMGVKKKIIGLSPSLVYEWLEKDNPELIYKFFLEGLGIYTGTFVESKYMGNYINSKL